MTAVVFEPPLPAVALAVVADCVSLADVPVLAAVEDPLEAVAVSVVVVVASAPAEPAVELVFFEAVAARCMVESVRVDPLEALRTSATVEVTAAVAAPMLPSAKMVPHMLASRISAVGSDAPAKHLSSAAAGAQHARDLSRLAPLVF